MNREPEALSPQLRKQLRDLQTPKPRELSESQRLLLSLAGKLVSPRQVVSSPHPRDSQNKEFQKLYQKDLDAALKIKERLLAMISKDTETVASD